MKKFLIGGSIAIIAAFALIAAPASAATPNWNIAGSWNLDFDFNGGHYLHTMNVASFDTTTGAFSGTGVYVADPSYTWDVTGTVDGDSITFDISYTGANAGYASHSIGTITSSTSITGTWLDSSSKAGTLTSSGTAVAISDQNGEEDQADEEDETDDQTGDSITSTPCAENLELTAETKACVLWTNGVKGKGILTAPGLQKPFNSNSQAWQHAGKKLDNGDENTLNTLKTSHKSERSNSGSHGKKK